METYHGYVKTPQDAILLFEACRIGFLSRIQRRLSEKERSSIRSGSVFVWDEREAGMRRWTDGKSWSASRVSGSFLTYRELESKRKSNSPTEQCRYKHGGLVKQSFSITTTAHQKLHLICYYTKADVISEKLQIPMNDEKLKGIIIPKGMYPETSNVDGVPQHQLPFPASYPPQNSSSASNGHQLPPQDIPWEKIRNTEDQRQLEAIYTNLKLF
ncbi:Gti1/Pac2 family-domain-containing protein [Rhizophagus diaphanus]|nr:Gti1/Pac2 family-domain-containing protein [Rhizophagus diaphanus] [Rhizophagus sp. MUCL 43196]